MKLQNLYFFCYFLLTTKWSQLNEILRYYSRIKNVSPSKIGWNILKDSILYGASFMDFFHYDLYNKTKSEKEAFAFTGFMYQFFLRLNPKKSRKILNNKVLFLEKYNEFIKRQWISIRQLEESPEAFNDFKSIVSGKVVLKDVYGSCGKSIKVININEFAREEFIYMMKKNKVHLVEQFFIQHPRINILAPSAVNTIRIVTFLHKDDVVEIFSARFRISVNGVVDNASQGGLAAVVNLETGVLESNGISLDIRKAPETHHPITMVRILGFQLPFWKETVELVKRAAVLHPQNKTIGWDVAISENGAELIEGNHNWGHTIIQRTSQIGEKERLLKFYKEYE